MAIFTEAKHDAMVQAERAWYHQLDYDEDDTEFSQPTLAQASSL